MVVDGASPKPVSVLSGVPQGTVLGSLMFLLYINDITSTDRVSSTLHLFTEDFSLIKNQIPKFNITSKRPGSVILLGFNMADEI